MMKKILLLSSALIALCFASTAQNGKQGVNPKGNVEWQVTSSAGSKAASTPTSVTDVLHYYLNKVYYKEGTTNLATFPYYKSAASTATGVSHMGSRFDVPAGDTVIVTGLEAYAQKHAFMAPTNYVKVHIFLCNLNASGMPILPPIDSIVTGVGIGASSTPSLIGGNFTNAHKMANSYAVLFRNMSTISGDTVHLLRTNGATPTSTLNVKYKYSDVDNAKDYGFVRYGSGSPAQFYSTRDFTLGPGFGKGTQYEFIVAPRVTYSLQAGQITPIGIESDTSHVAPDTNCTRQIMTFTNTSSKFYEHRMFNLNAFYLKWAPGSNFLSQPPGGWSADSAITWSFEFYDLPGQDSRVFLHYVNNGTISAQTDLSYYPLCFTNNEFRARLRPMGAFNLDPQLIFNQSFTVCLRYCNGDTVGVHENNALTNINVYPNPAVNGKTNISGLQGANSVMIYNILGQVMAAELTSKPEFEVDLTKYPQGTYVIRIVDANQRSKTIKVLHQN